MLPVVKYVLQINTSSGVNCTTSAGECGTGSVFMVGVVGSVKLNYKTCVKKIQPLFLTWVLFLKKDLLGFLAPKTLVDIFLKEAVLEGAAHSVK
jgi:hypothetical protein